MARHISFPVYFPLILFSFKSPTQVWWPPLVSEILNCHWVHIPRVKAAGAQSWPLSAIQYRVSIRIHGSVLGTLSLVSNVVTVHCSELGEISCSHGDEHKDGSLPGCCAVQSVRNWLTFQRCLLSSPWWWRQYAPLKRWSISTRLRNIPEDSSSTLPTESYAYHRRR
jgi:hypothetical protein